MSESPPHNTAAQKQLLDAIDAKIGEVRTEAIDLTFGEIINLRTNNEITINPEYQRLFRWSMEQRSRLVESILLRLPIPPVFFIENEDGTLELIDGLQRISSILQFIEPKLIDLDALTLSGCDIIAALNGYVYADLPLTLRLQLKRSVVRALIIKRQSKYFLRYEMFKRLNNGGSELSEQEIRNCSARLFGDDGVAFYEMLTELSTWPSFMATTEILADIELERRGREELVLRYFAAKNGATYYHGHVGEWLDGYMEAILLKSAPFDAKSESETFRRAFDSIDRILGDAAFCKYKDDKPTGGLAPAHFEAIAIGVTRELAKCEKTDAGIIRGAITAARQTKDFRDNVGPGANKKSKLQGRVDVIQKAIQNAK